MPAADWMRYLLPLPITPPVEARCTDLSPSLLTRRGSGTASPLTFRDTVPSFGRVTFAMWSRIVTIPSDPITTVKLLHYEIYRDGRLRKYLLVGHLRI